MEKARWLGVMHALGLPAEDKAYAQLIAAYSEKHRHYHTVEHIDHCLHELDREYSLAHEPAEVELALWFHGVVYNPHRSDNEQSADLACSLLRLHAIDSSRIDRVHAHIMSTRHDALAKIADSQLVVDIDLSILGEAEDVYRRFEHAVRKEYRWVPWMIFRRKRAEILRSFLARATIYSTESFKDRYEARARQNLAWAIAELRK